ncbi:MAG: response regulator, partial [Candidatus Marinimicrobia bacterium]|nr:response regulator [Candidatus Neomarinimicrobiota bacterium]
MVAKKNTVLIVDDVALNLDLLSSLLIEKYRVKVAKDGPAAIKIVQDVNPDLILLDVMMPGMNGFQVCEQLKSDPQTKDIPIIFLTAKTETGDIVRGFEVGGVDYLTKPFNSPELLIRVDTQILIKEQKDLISRQNREQKEMLHILSHDLANHFGIISFALELSKINPGKLDEYYFKIKNATSHGIDIIELVREMRSLEEKGLELTGVNLAGIVAESVQLLADRYREKNIGITI